MMKITAIVPIKLNNERLPGKNTRMMGGKPLLSYCIDTLLEIKEIDQFYVYCSDPYIEQFLPTGVRFLKRSEKLDGNNTNFTQIFSAFSNEIFSDIYVYAHATAPFVKAETIRKELNAVIKDGYDSSFCAERIQDFLWQNGKPLNFDASNIPRSQDIPPIWRETSGVYVFKREVFLKYKRRIGIKPYIMEVSRKEAVDINTYDDFQFAELML